MTRELESIICYILLFLSILLLYFTWENHIDEVSAKNFKVMQLELFTQLYQKEARLQGKLSSSLDKLNKNMEEFKQEVIKNFGSIENFSMLEFFYLKGIEKGTNTFNNEE